MHYPLFDWLTNEEVEKIKWCLIDLEYKKKEAIYTKSVLWNVMFDEVEKVWFYFIEKWIVKISVIYELKNYTIAFLKGWDFFWEMSSLLWFKPTADIYALEDTRIRFLPSDDFNRLLKEIPNFWISLSKYLANRVQFLSWIIFDHVFKSLEWRVASNLINMINEFWEEKDWKIYLKIKVTHQDLADFIWTNRETVTKTLNNFKKNWIIDFLDRKIVVLDFEKLKGISLK